MSNDTRIIQKLPEVKPKPKNRRPRGSRGKGSVQKRKLALVDRYVKDSAGKKDNGMLLFVAPG